MLRNEGKEGETKLAEEGKVEEDVNFGEEESRQSGKQRVKYDKSAKYDKHGKNSQANVKREKVQNEIEGGRKHAVQGDEDRWSSHDKTYGKPCCGHATPHATPCCVGPSVRPSIRSTLHLSFSLSVRQIFDLRAVFASLLLSNRPRLECLVSGFVCTMHLHDLFVHFPRIR